MTPSPLSLDDPEGVQLMSASPKRKPAEATLLKLASALDIGILTLQYPMIALMTLTLLIPGALKPQYVLNEATMKAFPCRYSKS